MPRRLDVSRAVSISSNVNSNSGIARCNFRGNTMTQGLGGNRQTIQKQTVRWCMKVTVRLTSARCWRRSCCQFWRAIYVPPLN